jgi:uroporphyrin-III C-methyltransferase
MEGRVYMIGAGPGAADLLTVRAASVLQRADVVLHDDLVPPEILALAPASAEVVNVGKRCGSPRNSQQQINTLMIEHARQGRNVVRLKSGDPALFGRLGEELEALRDAEIRFDIIPGITAASAAAATASFTLTDRRAASALVILTGSHCRKEGSAEKLFDPARTTYAVYMPGPDYAKTSRQLLELGLDEQTPCALISHAGRREQTVQRLALSELSSVQAIPAPAILIAGEVTRAESLPEFSAMLSANTPALCAEACFGD